MTIVQLIKIIEKYFKIKIKNLYAENRKPRMVYYRQIFIYFATKYNFPYYLIEYSIRRSRWGFRHAKNRIIWDLEIGVKETIFDCDEIEKIINSTYPEAKKQ